MRSILLKSLLLLLLQLTWVSGEGTGRSDLEKEILQNIFFSSKFQTYVRPHKNENQTDEPLDVIVSLFVINIEVDVKTQECTLHMYFRQEWNDSRLTYNGEGKVDSLSIHDAVALWTPDLFFVSEKLGQLHILTKPNIFIRIYPNGRVLYSQRITVKFACTMDLRKYPFDSQICVLPIESFGYTASDILLKWKPDITFALSDPPGLQVSYTTREQLIHLASGNYSRLELDIHINRLAYSQLIHVYVPLGFLVVSSWITFCLQPSRQIPRLTAIVITTFTTLLLIRSVKDFLHSVCYLTALDVWVGFACFLIFAAVFENIYVIAYYEDNSKIYHKSKRDVPELPNGKRDKRRLMDIFAGDSKVDAISRMVFPFVFILFNVIYLAYYLI